VEGVVAVAAVHLFGKLGKRCLTFGLVLLVLLTSGCLKEESATPFDRLTLSQAITEIKRQVKDSRARLAWARGEDLKRDGQANWREIALLSGNGKTLFHLGYLAPLPPQANVPAPKVIAKFPQESGSDLIIYAEDITGQTPLEPLKGWLDPQGVNARNQWFWDKTEKLFKQPYEAKVSLSITDYEGKKVWEYEVDWGEPVEKISPTEYKMRAKTSRFYFDLITGKNVGPRSW